MYKLSIVVPVFNVEDTLHLAFDSIYNQDFGFENVEVIFIDDASTDSSPQIIDEYESKYANVRAIHLTENSGYAGKPRNIGIENASGDYLMFLDPDDEFLPNACSLLYETINDNNLEVVSGNYIHNGELYKWNDIELNDDCLNLNSIYDEPEIFKFTPAVWCKIFKKQFVLDNNIRFPTDVPGQDLVFVFHCLLKARGICYINKPILNYLPRLTGSNVSVTTNKNKKNLIGYLKAYYEICDLLSDNPQYFKYVLKHLNFFSKQLILSDIEKADKLDILAFANQLYQLFKITDGVRPNKVLKTFFNDVYVKNYIGAIYLCDSIALKLKENDLNLHNEIKSRTVIVPIFEKDDIEKVLIPVNSLASKNYSLEIINFCDGLNFDRFNDSVEIIDIFKEYTIDGVNISLKDDEYNYIINFDKLNDFYNYYLTKTCLLNENKPFLIGYDIDKNIAFGITGNQIESVDDWDDFLFKTFVNEISEELDIRHDSKKLHKENNKPKPQSNSQSSSGSKFSGKIKNIFTR